MRVNRSGHHIVSSKGVPTRTPTLTRNGHFAVRSSHNGGLSGHSSSDANYSAVV